MFLQSVICIAECRKWKVLIFIMFLIPWIPHKRWAMNIPLTFIPELNCFCNSRSTNKRYFRYLPLTFLGSGHSWLNSGLRVITVQRIISFIWLMCLCHIIYVLGKLQDYGVTKFQYCELFKVIIDRRRLQFST